MGVINYIAQFGAWSWIAAGLVLFGLELMVPGGFLLWLGVAGIATGLLTLIVPLAWPLQWLIFGVLGLLSIAAWVRFNRNRVKNSDRPYLNRRADRFIGHEGVLDEPIIDGYGRLPLGDTVWRIAGPDMAVGQRVRIVSVEGTVLKVEAI